MDLTSTCAASSAPRDPKASVATTAFQYAFAPTDHRIARYAELTKT